MNLPSVDVIKAASAALKSSELVQEVTRSRSLFSLLSSNPASLRKAGFQPLSSTQIRQLTAQGNSADDWKKVWVAKKFDAKRVNRCHFAGPVILS